MPVIFVLLSSLLCIATAFVLRRNFAGVGSVSFSGFNGVGVLAGFAFFVGSAVVLGLPFGAPLIATFLLLEMGRVLAYRMLGHSDARFRLVPLISKSAISDTPLKSDGEVFLVSILGPALSLGPMALAATLAIALPASMKETAEFLWLFTATCGAVNFINLLPVWPFDGGKCTRTAVAEFWPALAPAMTIFMSTAMLTASLRTGSLTLMVVAGIGAQSLFRRKPTASKTMNPDSGLIALAAYVFTMAAHFSAGWMLFEAYF